MFGMKGKMGRTKIEKNICKEGIFSFHVPSKYFCPSPKQVKVVQFRENFIFLCTPSLQCAQTEAQAQNTKSNVHKRTKTVYFPASFSVNCLCSMRNPNNGVDSKNFLKTIWLSSFIQSHINESVKRNDGHWNIYKLSKKLDGKI